MSDAGTKHPTGAEAGPGRDAGAGVTPHAALESADALADRYGRSAGPRRRRTTILTAVVAGVVGLAAVVWLAAGQLSVPVHTMDVGFSIVDDTAIDVTFDVVKAPETTVVCRVRALSPSFAEIGVRDVVVGPSAERASRVTVRVATSGLATTGLVQRCDPTQP